MGGGGHGAAKAIAAFAVADGIRGVSGGPCGRDQGTGMHAASCRYLPIVIPKNPTSYRLPYVQRLFTRWKISSAVSSIFLLSVNQGS
jgi:hypothetical protein